MKGRSSSGKRQTSVSCESLISNVIGQGSLGTELLIYGGNKSEQTFQQDW